MSEATRQKGKCPPWCVIDHNERDLPMDRAHRDDGTDVPAIMRRKKMIDGKLTYVVVPGELTFGRWKHLSHSEEWVLIGDNEGVEIEMSVDSFMRLMRALEVFEQDFEGHHVAA